MGIGATTNYKQRNLSQLNILIEDNTKVGELSGDCTLH